MRLPQLSAHGAHALQSALIAAALAASISRAAIEPALAIGPNDMNIGLSVKARVPPASPAASRLLAAPPTLAASSIGLPHDRLLATHCRALTATRHFCHTSPPPPSAAEAYEECDCPPELAQGRAGGALGAGAGGSGIAQKCVRVSAQVDNPRKEAVEDAGVFGVVTETTTGMSVLGNGQDGKNDAGQFAMIPKVPPGKSDVEFVFVSQQADDCVPSKKKVDGKLVITTCPVQGSRPLVGLSFDKMKAIAYPGGDRYKLYDECEQNEFAEGC